MGIFDSLLGGLFGNSKTPGNNMSNKTTTSQLPGGLNITGTQLDLYSNYQYVYQSLQDQLKGYTVSTLNIEARQKNITEKTAEYNKIKAEEDIINSLHPKTIEILKLAFKLSSSNKFEDVVELDNLVRKTLFSNKIQDLIE